MLWLEFEVNLLFFFGIFEVEDDIYVIWYCKIGLFLILMLYMYLFVKGVLLDLIIGISIY